jgi:hypothetical protein
VASEKQYLNISENNCTMNSVLYVHRTQGEGVEAVHILGIARSLETLGYFVDFLSPAGNTRPRTLSESNKKKKRKFLSLVSKNMPEIFFELGEIFYNVYVYMLSGKYTKNGAYSFVYERYAIFSIVGYLIASKKKCPLVLEINYTSRSPLVRKRSKILKPFARMVDKWLYERTDAFVAVSTQLKNELINEYGVKERIIEV